MDTMGSRLKALRKERHLSQKTVGQQLGCAPSTISAYESDERIPPGDMLLGLARIYGVSTDYLLGRSLVRELDLSGLTDRQISFVVQLTELFRDRQDFLN